MSGKKVLRWLKFLPIPVILFAVIGLIVDREWTRHQGNRHLTETVAHLDNTDPDWRFEQIERRRPALDDAQNGALIVPKFVAVLPKPGFETDPVLNSDEVARTPPNQRYSAAVTKALEPHLANSEPALLLAQSFKGITKGRHTHQLGPNYIDTLLPNVQESRSIVRLLDWHAEWLLEQNRPADAFATTTAMWNVSHTLADDPFYISALVRIALLHVGVKRVERLLALHTPTVADLARLQQELEVEAGADLFWHALRAERGGMSTIFDNVRSGAIDFQTLSRIGNESSGAKTTKPEATLGMIVYSPHRGGDHAKFLELTTRAYDVRKLAESEQLAALQAIEEEVKPLREEGLKYLLTCSLTPSFTKIFLASHRTKALLRCAVLGMACERFRQQQGRWPNTLDELPAALTPFQNDPFTGTPLRLQQRADGLTIYSIGSDNSDDKGAIFDVPPAVGAKVDYGFRLYNPDQRNRPAK